MINIKLTYVVKEEDNGKALKHILRDKLNVSSRLLIKLKMNNRIYVNDKQQFVNFVVYKDDVVLADIDFEEDDDIIPEYIKLEILYEDEYILAINKPAGMVVHPTTNHYTNTLANGVKYYLNNKRKIRPINRLDRDTSGIVLFAKDEYTQEEFIRMANPKKEYITIVSGLTEHETGTIDLPIARKEGSIMERCIDEAGQKAVTHYEVTHTNKDKHYSVLRVNIETGRTHQIRVHMAHIGHSILGDTLYR